MHDKLKFKTKPTLRGVFHFTEDDLAANQIGNLSARQLAQLQRELRFQITVWIIVFLIILLVFVLLTFVMPLNPGLTLVSVMITVGVFVMIKGKPLYNLYLDQQYGQAAIVDGYASLHVDLHNPYFTFLAESAYYYVTVANEKFAVTEKTLMAFNENDFYTIYFTPRSHRIMSVQHIKQNLFE